MYPRDAFARLHDLAPGGEALKPKIERRGFGECPDWLPGHERA